MAMRRALVSGVTGHLGRELARQLLAAGVEVHGLTREHAPAAHRWIDGVRFHRLDGGTQTLIDVLREARPDTVFHLASLYRGAHQSADIEPLVQSNVLFGAQLLEAMSVVECTRFVTAASHFQHYEAHVYRPVNLYAATKQAFEDILEYYVDALGFSAASLFLYEIYSEGDTRPKLMSAIAGAWANGVPLELPRDEVRLDLVHVEDAAAAFLHVAAMLESGAIGKAELQRYSVCSGQDVTPTELAALFERLGGRRLTIERGRFARPGRAVQTPWRGTRLPGWAPRMSLEEGILRIVSKRR